MEKIIPKHVDFAAQANLTEADYEALVTKFKSKPRSFWLDLARENLTWFNDDAFADIVFEQHAEENSYEFNYFKNGLTNISYHCLDAQVAKHPDKTAIIYETEPGDSKSYTYRELLDLTCQISNAFLKQGLVKGDKVCIYMPTMPEAIATMLACTRVGLVHSVVFAGFSAEALADRLQNLEAKMLVTADFIWRKGNKVWLYEAASEAANKSPSVEKVMILDRTSSKQAELERQLDKAACLNFEQEVSRQSHECAPAHLEAEHPSFVLYTSGSTGKPKGLQHSTAGYILWAKLSTNWVFDLKPNDIYWCTASIGWITGHTYLVYGPLANGATCLVYEGAPMQPDAGRFWSLIEKYKVSIFYTAPTAIRAWMQAGDDWANKYDLSSLRLLGTVGEPINPVAWHWFYEVIGEKRCPIVDTWWQTETGGIMITSLPGVHDMKPGSAGKPLPGVELEMVDKERLHISEALPSMARTIHADKQRFYEAYWSVKQATYTTGDVAEIDSQGFTTIKGRFDDVINVSGHRLGTAEIESALVAHEQVTEAAVVAIPHDIKGEAIVCFASGSASENQIPDLSAQIESAIGKLARPERIYLVDALPKTRSGKIMRRVLRDIAMGKNVTGDLSTIENKSVVDSLSKLNV